MKSSLVVLVLVLVFLLLDPGWAEPWTPQGQVWKHPKGISLEAPADTVVESDGKDDSLEIEGAKDDFFVGCQLSADKAEAEKRVAQLRASLDDAKPSWKEANLVNDNFSQVAESGSGNINGKEADFSLGYLTKNGKYLVFLTTSTVEDKARIKAIIAKLLLSVRFL